MNPPTSKIRVAINGFGRIGRYTAKLLLSHPSFELVAINDLAEKEAIKHLLKYDSIHGKFEAKIALSEENLFVNGNEIHLLSTSNPEALPWKELKIDVVMECTGRFTHADGALKHLIAGAEKVIISAPAQDLSIPMIVMGVNDHILTGFERIISNASCTTT